MGMYTGLKLDVTFKKTAPDEFYEALNYMLTRGDLETGVDHEWETPLEHPLFHQKTERWRWMLCGSSAYLDEDFAPNSTLNGYRLKVCFNIKNYENEIGHFLHWIHPHVKEFHSGCWQYEEMDEPKLVKWCPDYFEM